MSRAGRLLPLAAVAALLGAAMIAAVFSNPRIGRIVEGRGTFETPPAPATEALSADPRVTISAPPDGAVGLPAWLTWLATAVCAAAVMALVASLLWLMLRDRLLERRRLMAAESASEPFGQAKLQVRTAVEEGLANLDDDDLDPRRAVIACWVRLEEAAATAGTARHVGDTSTDLVRRLLATQHVSAEMLDGLAAVYRAARFATHDVDAAMRARAREALRQLRAELVVGAR